MAHAGFQLLAWLYILPVSIYIAKNKFEQLSDSHDETREVERMDSSGRHEGQEQILVDDIETTSKGQEQGEHEKEDALWLRWHKKLNVVAMYSIVIAILIILFDHRAVGASKEEHDDHDDHSHRRLSLTRSTSLPHVETGWTLFSVVCVQVFLGIKRPEINRMPERSRWKKIHKSLGYFVLPFFVVWQIITGLMKSSTDTIIVIVSIFVPVLILLYLVSYYRYYMFI